MIPPPRLACRACGHPTAPLGVQYCDRCFVPEAVPAVEREALVACGATVVVLTGGPARWPEHPVAAPGVTVTIEPSLAALRDAVEEEPVS